MRTRILAATMAGLLAGVCQAQLTSNRMVKVVARDTSPSTPRDSFRAKPKTLYRMGATYGRLEEMPDPVRKVHVLIVVAEPKMWIINLWDKTGELVIDPGPTYVFVASIIPPRRSSEAPPLHALEFGREYQFLRDHDAVAGRETFQGRERDTLEASVEGYAVKLTSEAGKERPLRITVAKSGGVVCQYDYDDYKTDLPPEMRLFAPPVDVEVADAAEP